MIIIEITYVRVISFHFMKRNEHNRKFGHSSFMVGNRIIMMNGINEQFIILIKNICCMTTHPSGNLCGVESCGINTSPYQVSI